MSDWRIGVIKALDGKDAMRILTTIDLKRVIRMHRDVSDPIFKQFINTLCDNKYLIRIARGIYLNANSTPVPSMSETAQYIRPGSVVSLQTVLGDCGFINNPSSIVTAITTDHGVKFSGELITSEDFKFQFRYIPGALSHSRIGGLDESCHYYQRATPERALVDWIYFANSPYSPLTYPPSDVDMSVIDLQKAYELANKLGMQAAVQSWNERAHSLGFGDDEYCVKAISDIKKVKTKKHVKSNQISWSS